MKKFSTFWQKVRQFFQKHDLEIDSIGTGAVVFAVIALTFKCDVVLWLLMGAALFSWYARWFSTVEFLDEQDEKSDELSQREFRKKFAATVLDLWSRSRQSFDVQHPADREWHDDTIRVRNALLNILDDGPPEKSKEGLDILVYYITAE